MYVCSVPNYQLIQEWRTRNLEQLVLSYKGLDLRKRVMHMAGYILVPLLLIRGIVMPRSLWMSRNRCHTVTYS